MEALFRIVLNMSGTGAIVICVVLLMRLLLRRAPKRYSYWLWSAAAFRLVCPVSFRSVFSVFSLAPAAVPSADVGVVGSSIAYVPPAAVQMPAATPLPAVSETVAAATPAASGTATAAASAAQSMLFLLGFVWLAGVAAMLIWGAVSYARLSNRLRTAVYLRENVWQTDAVDSPFLMGFLRPRIYIPFGLSGERLDYVLAHERFHIAHRDDLVKLLGFLILALHWFNPLVWLGFVLMGRDMEMRCDEAVLGHGAAASKQYSETLLSFAVGGRFPRPGPLAFGESGVKARIRNALRWKKPKTWVTVLAALLCAAAVAACAANPVKLDDETPEEPPSASAAVSGPGAYTGVEGYIRSEVLRDCETNGVTEFREDGSAVRVTVAETALIELSITGALNDLDPQGQLQSWVYHVRLVLAEDTPPLAAVSGLTEENGRYVLDWSRNVVALAYPNGRVDILYDMPVNDNSTFLGWHESYEEAIYDWYVTANGLDLPLWVTDWGANLNGSDSFPVRRFEGDGWFIYIPVTGWQIQEPSIKRCIWTTASGTGTTVTVREATKYEASAKYEYPAGVAAHFYAAPDGRYWCVTTRYDPTLELNSSWLGKEPEIVQRIGASFRLIVTPEETAEALSAEALRTLRQDDPEAYTALMRGWNAQVGMVGEQFISTAGEAGEWRDVRAAFADRWCEKYLNASADNPVGCANCGIWEIGTYLDAISLTSAPRRLAFNVSLTLSPRDEAAFIEARAGWGEKMPDGRYRISTEAVLISDDGVRWTVEALNSGGSGGWGYRTRDSVDVQQEIAYALGDEDRYGIHLLRYLPNLDWTQLSAAEFNRVAEKLRTAAVKTDELQLGENDQRIRDLYMLWGLKTTDGAYAALFLDGPDAMLAVQYRADPDTFMAALSEMDEATQTLVRHALTI